MKNIIVLVCVMINFICCNSGNKQQNEIQNNDVIAENSQALDPLPDSLFHNIDMSFFDIPSIPYNESIGSPALYVATGTFRQKMIDTIKELKGISRTNVFYLSKQLKNKDGFLITIYTENEIDPGSIYLLSLDRDLNLIDYSKVGYEQCDLEDQNDTCEISFCNIMVAYKKGENDYTVVSRKEREFNCKDGKRTEAETDSIQLTIKSNKFFYGELK